MHLFSLYCIPFLLVSIFSCMFSHNPYQVMSAIERCVWVNGYDVCLMKHSDIFFHVFTPIGLPFLICLTTALAPWIQDTTPYLNQP